MPFPAGTPVVTLTGTLPAAALGTGYQGRAILTPTAALIDSTRHAVYPGGGSVNITDGQFTVQLIPTNAPGIQPDGWLWEVDIQPANGRRIIFHSLIDGNDGDTIQLDSLVPVPAPNGTPPEPYQTYTDQAIAAEVVRADAAYDPAGAASTAQAAAISTAADDATTKVNAVATRVTTLEQLEPDLPSDQNLLAWTYDPNMAGHVTAQSSGGVAGRITLVRLILRKQITWSNIWLGLAGVDAAASLANCYLGVYDSSGTLKAATADISSSLMSGATAKPLALTTPFTAPAGTYFIAMLLNGTWTTNSLTFKASGAGVSVNAGLAAPNLRYSNMLTGQTSLPASLNLASQATSIISTGWASQWYGVS